MSQWKAAQAVQEVLAKADRITWPMRLKSMDIGPWCIVPLDSSDALICESFAMRNCLRNYIVECATGVAEYYSIRNKSSGKRIACVGFKVKPDEETGFIDVKGFANSQVSRETSSVTHQLRFLFDNSGGVSFGSRLTDADREESKFNGFLARLDSPQALCSDDEL